MLLHKIATYHGKQVQDGKEIHAYKTVCGSPILGLLIFKQHQLVAVGAPPHAQCAKCFKAPQAQPARVVVEGDRPVQDPDRGFGSLGKRAEGAMLDDQGLPISAPFEKTDIVGNAIMDPYAGKTLGVKKTQRDGDRIIKTEIDDPMGNIESSDFG